MYMFTVMFLIKRRFLKTPGFYLVTLYLDWSCLILFSAHTHTQEYFQKLGWIGYFLLVGNFPETFGWKLLLLVGNFQKRLGSIENFPETFGKY